VIAIIAILVAILFPVFAKAKAMARQTQCLSNVKQLTLAGKMYAADYNDRYPAYSGEDGWNPWFYCESPNMDAATIELHGGTLRPYFASLYQGATYIATADNRIASRIIVCPDWKNDMWPRGGPYSDSLYGVDTEMEKYKSYGANAGILLHWEGEIGDPTAFVMLCENCASQQGLGGGHGCPCIELWEGGYPWYCPPAFRHGDRRMCGVGWADGHASMVNKKLLWPADWHDCWTMWHLRAMP